MTDPAPLHPTLPLAAPDCARVPAAEAAALREGAGLWFRDGWGVTRVVGRDGLRFLHKNTSQDVAGLAPGRGARACALTVKGALVGDLRLLAREGDLLLLTAPAARTALVEHLARFALFDDVRFEDLAAPGAPGALVWLSLWGPRAAAVVEAALGAGPPTDDLAHVAVDLAARGLVEDTPAGPATLVRDDEVGHGCDVLAPAGARGALEAALVAAGAVVVGPAAVQQARVRAGVPWYGVDMDAETLPLEVGLERRSISFTKGCYVGQEVVARVAHRGHVNRHLVRLRLDAPPAALPVAIVRDDGPGDGPGAGPAGGKPVGRVTSWAPGPDGAPEGLGLLHRKHAAPGAVVRLADGGAATVVERLPAPAADAAAADRGGA